jgi:hypothetical protein
MVARSFTGVWVALAATFIVEVVNFARNAKCNSSWMDCDMLRLNSDESLLAPDPTEKHRGPLGPPPAVQA